MTSLLRASAVLLLLANVARAASVDLGGGFWEVTPPDGLRIRTTIGGGTVTVHPNARLKGGHTRATLHFIEIVEAGPGDVVGTLFNDGRVQAGRSGMAVGGGNSLEIHNGGDIVGDVVMNDLSTEPGYLAYAGREGSRLLGAIQPMEDAEYRLNLAGAGFMRGDLGAAGKRWRTMQMFDGGEDGRLVLESDAYIAEDAHFYEGDVAWKGVLTAGGDVVIHEDAQITLDDAGAIDARAIVLDGGKLIARRGAGSLGEAPMVVNGGQLIVRRYRDRMSRNTLKNDLVLNADLDVHGVDELKGDVTVHGSRTIHADGIVSYFELRISGDVTGDSLTFPAGVTVDLVGSTNLDELSVDGGATLTGPVTVSRFRALSTAYLNIYGDLTGDGEYWGGTFNEATIRGSVAIHGYFSNLGNIEGDVTVHRNGRFAGREGASVRGNVTFLDGSRYFVTLPTAGGERPAVVGQVVFAPDSSIWVSRSSDGPVSHGDTYTILSATGGLVIPESVLDTIGSNYLADIRDDELVVTVFDADRADNPWEVGDVGEAVDADIRTGRLRNQLLGLDPRDRLAALPRLTGERHAAAGSGAIDAARGGDTTLANHLQTTRSGPTARSLQLPGGREGASLAMAAAEDPRAFATFLDEADGEEATAAAARGPARTWGGFAQAFGVYTDEETAGDRIGFSSVTAGGVAGLDVRVREGLLVGWSGGYSRSDLEFAESGGEGDVDSFRTGPYASWWRGRWSVDASLTGGYHRNDVERRVVVGGFDETAEADYDAWDVSGYLGAGYVLPVGEWTLTPRASLQWTHYERERFTEEGAGAANLVVDRDDVDALRSRVGVTLSREVELAGRAFVPEVSLGWAHRFDETTDQTARFATGTTPFTTSVGRPAEDSLLYGAGVAVLLSDRASGYLRYEGEAGDDTQSHTVVAGLRMDF